MEIKIPELALVVLIDTSGSGKSTFARKQFLATEKPTGLGEVIALRNNGASNEPMTNQFLLEESPWLPLALLVVAAVPGLADPVTQSWSTCSDGDDHASRNGEKQ